MPYSLSHFESVVLGYLQLSIPTDTRVDIFLACIIKVRDKDTGAGEGLSMKKTNEVERKLKYKALTFHRKSRSFCEISTMCQGLKKKKRDN